MSNSSNFRIVIESDSEDALRKTERVVKSINDASAAVERYKRERQSIARTERQDRFRALSAEEQYNKLLVRREQLERRAYAAEQKGNKERLSAVQLLLARNRSNIRNTQSRLRPPPVIAPNAPPPVIAPTQPGLLSRLGSAIGGNSMGSLAGRAAGTFAGGLIGSLGGPVGVLAGLGGSLVIGGLIAKVGSAVINMVQESLHTADTLNDLADQSETSIGEILRLKTASGASGVPLNRLLGGLSAIGAARGNALAGDEKSISAFSAFGVGMDQLRGNASNAAIGGILSRTAISSENRNAAGMLFGRRPEQILSGLRAFEALNETISSETEQSLARLDKTNAKIDAALVALSLVKVRLTAQLLEMSESIVGIAFAATQIIGQTLVGRMAKTMALMTLAPFGSQIQWAMTQAGQLARESGLVSSNTSWADKRRMEDSALFPTPPNSKSKPNLLGPAPNLPALNPIVQSEALARMGLLVGSRDPEGAGLLRKQLQVLLDIYREQRETVKTNKEVL